MLEQPRTATRTKSKEKRVSAPPSLLASQVKAFSPRSNKPTATDDLLGLFSSGNEETNEATNTTYKTTTATATDVTKTTGTSSEKKGSINPRDSVNTQIVQGLFDMMGQTSAETKKGTNSNNNSNDLDDFFGFDTDATSKPKEKTKPSGERNTAPPKTIQAQAITGLKVIQEGEVLAAKSSKKGDDNKEKSKPEGEAAEAEEDEEEEEEEEEEDEKDSDSDNEKGKNTAKQLSEEMNKQRTRSASNQVTVTNKDNSTQPTTSSSTSSSSSSSSSSSTSNSKGQTDALAELHRGTPLLKYPHRRGFPHFKYTQLSKDNTTLQWFSRKKKMEATCIRISDVKDVLKGQETQVFRKFQQTALEKASFSVVFGRDYQSLDLVAKSTDECDLWVLALKELMSLSKKGTDLTKLRELIVPVNFKDRNRPQSRIGSGRFVRANESNERKVDTQELREVKKEMSDLKKTFERVKQLSQNPNIAKSSEIDNIRLVVSELEERLDELTQEINDTRDTEMSKRDVWRASVDLQAIEEKIEVVAESTQKGKRLSNFW